MRRSPARSPTLDAAFDAGQVHVAQGSLEQVAATFRAVPNGSLMEAATRIGFAGDAKVTGLHLADPALDRAVGQNIALTMRGSASPNGEAAFDALDLAASSLDASFSGQFGRERVNGKLKVMARDLSRLDLITGVSLKGEARIAADLDGAPRYGALTATLDAHASRFESGQAILDRVLGGELDLTGVARSLTGGGFRFDDLKAAGKHGSARLDGVYASDKVDLSAKVDVPQTQFLDPRVTGRAQAVAALTGDPVHLDANLTASLGEGRLLDRPTSGLTLEAQARDIFGQIDATARAHGDVDRQPLRASAHLAKQPDGGFLADDLALRLASARLAGSVKISADRLADGEVTFSAKNLDDLSPLVLTKLSGSVEAKLNASSADGRQGLAIVADSDRMSVADNALDGVKINVTIGDLWAARNISGVASLTRAKVSGQTFANVKLTASPRGDATDLDLSALAGAAALKARGQLIGGSPIRFDLASLTAEGGGQKLALAHPTTLVFRDGLDIENLVLAVNAGRLSLTGHTGSTLDLHATAAGLPLSALDLVAPGLGFAGVADGEATIKGTPGDPTGDWRLRVKGFSTPQGRGMVAPLLDVAGSGRLDGGRTSLDAVVNAGGNTVRATGSAPLSADGALDIRIAGKLDAGLANTVLSVAGRRVSGALAVDLQLRGTMAKPQAVGSLSLSNGSFRDEETGFKLASISALLRANGDALRIERFTGSTPNGGSISASGEVRLDPAAGFPGAVRVTGVRAELVSTDTVTAVADLALDVSGALSQTPKVTGHITIDSMDITVPERLGGVGAPIPGTRHINPNAAARAMLALRAKARAANARTPLFNATLALTVKAANRIYVRGRGIYAEMSGNLSVSGSAASPQVTGGFDLLRGSLALLGKQLDFTRGRVSFHGDTTPDLDLVAETTAADVTAQISVTGPATLPVFTFTSNPSLPQDEILSRILFQNASGNLSAFQALQLANAVASLTGRGDAFEPLRKSLGVDSLNIGSSTSGSPSVGISRAISNRISVRATTGVRPADNGLSVDFDLTHHIRAQAGVDASGGSSVGVGADWEYK
jgi:translocation and assembly module TamB